MISGLLYRQSVRLRAVLSLMVYWDWKSRFLPQTMKGAVPNGGEWWLWILLPEQEQRQFLVRVVLRGRALDWSLRFLRLVIQYGSRVLRLIDAGRCWPRWIRTFVNAILVLVWIWRWQAVTSRQLTILVLRWTASVEAARVHGRVGEWWTLDFRGERFVELVSIENFRQGSVASVWRFAIVDAGLGRWDWRPNAFGIAPKRRAVAAEK